MLCWHELLGLKVLVAAIYTIKMPFVTLWIGLSEKKSKKLHVPVVGHHNKKSSCNNDNLSSPPAAEDSIALILVSFWLIKDGLIFNTLKIKVKP